MVRMHDIKVRAVNDQANEGRRQAQAAHGAFERLSLHGIVRLLDVVEDRVELTTSRATPVPRVEHFVDALRGRTTEHESTLGRVEDRMALEYGTESPSQQLGEEFAEAALQADRPNVGHHTTFRCILHQRHDNTRLPC